MKRLWVVVSVCLATALAGVRPAAGTEPFERLVPKETVAFMSARNVPDLLQKVKALPIYKVLAEEGFLEGLLPPEAYVQAKTFYGTYVEPLGGILKGEVAFTIVDFDMGAPEPPTMVLLADVAGTEGVLQKYLDERVFPWLDANEEVERKTEEIAGGTFTRIMDEWEDEVAALGVLDGVFYLFPFSTDVESLLKQLATPRDEALAANEWFVKVKASLAGADIIQYVNLGAIDRKARKYLVEEEEVPEDYEEGWGRFHAISGFKTLEAIGQGYTFGADGAETKICLFGDGPDGGIFGLLACEKPPLKSTEYVAEDAALYLALNLGDLGRAYEEFMAIVDQMESYEAEGVQDAIAAIEEVVDKEMEDEILPAFGGEIAVVAWVPQGLTIPPAAVMIEVKDKTAVGEMVARVLALIEDESGGEIEIESEEAEGVAVTLIHGVPMVEPAVGIVGDFLVIATNRSVIEGMVNTRAEGKQLAESTGYSQYVSAIPGDATITLYVDTPRIVNVGLPLLEAYLDVDEENAGPFAAIEKLAGALSPFGMKVVGSDEGITITSRSDNGGLGPVGVLAWFGILHPRVTYAEFEPDQEMIFDEDDEAVRPEDDGDHIGEEDLVF